MRLQQELDHQRKAGSHRAQTTRLKFDPELRIMPSEVLVDAIERLQRSGVTDKEVAAFYEKSVPIPLLHADVMRLCWRVARLEALADPQFAEEEVLVCPATTPMAREDILAEYREFTAWPFTNLRALKDPVSSIEIRGHGIARIIASESAMTAHVHDAGLTYTSLQTNANTPALENILRLRASHGIVDLRTGLVLTRHSDRRDTLIWAAQSGGLPLPPSSAS
jgi:hypothetical protein